MLQSTSYAWEASIRPEPEKPLPITAWGTSPSYGDDFQIPTWRNQCTIIGLIRLLKYGLKIMTQIFATDAIK